MFFDLALLAKATIVAKLILHTLFLIQMFVFPGVEVRLIWNALHLALIALYTFSRVTSAGVAHIDVLEWSFIAWAFLGHTVDFLARLLIPWVVVPALFEQYVASFDGEAFQGEAGHGKGTRSRGFVRWYHRTRLKLRRRYGRRQAAGYREPAEQDGIQGHGLEVPEQHLLGDIESQV